MTTKKTVLFFMVIQLITGITLASDENFYNPSPVPRFSSDSASLHADFFSDYLWEQGERNFYLDRMFQRLFFITRRAKNINEDGSVNNTPFFTNRIGITPMSAEEISRGGITHAGPDLTGKLTITSAKSDGLSVGFIIKDAKGGKFLIKLDIKSFPELNSSAEVISSRLFYALGYNVPEYSIVYFSSEQLEIKPGLLYYDESGFKVPFDQTALESVLKNSYFNKDRLYRGSASRFVEGVVLGPMSLRHHRYNDPRDQIPHEDRRELGGLRVFCAWLNHFDLRRGNTMDTLIQDENGWYIKHYLIDFGGTLGAHIKGPKPPETGHEYVFSFDEVIKSIVTLGFYPRPWERLEQITPQTGYFTNQDFHPEQWTTHIPNYAFQNMDRDDARWAAIILSKVTDENIRGAVEAGMITNERAKEDLINKLIERRNIIVQHWLREE